jgi:hypothetical protein
MPVDDHPGAHDPTRICDMPASQHLVPLPLRLRVGHLVQACRPFKDLGRRRAPWCMPGQLLDHQEAVQVIRARAAWPLRLGWKKSRVLTWPALNG